MQEPSYMTHLQLVMTEFLSMAQQQQRLLLQQQHHLQQLQQRIMDEMRLLTMKLQSQSCMTGQPGMPTQFCTPFSGVTGVLSTLPPKTETLKVPSETPESTWTCGGPGPDAPKEPSRTPYPQPAYYPVRRKWGPGCCQQQPGEEPVGRATPPPVGRLGPAGRVSPPVGR